ncbi:YbaK/EbsC family protein [Kutzneria sp. NPDC051319]|uniref:YbaK/EbsC family protein n=1 Tax=Kutzneria sp. NPDC051319 TaxID=3155047 RepID=UPI0034425F20
MSDQEHPGVSTVRGALRAAGATGAAAGIRVLDDAVRTAAAAADAVEVPVGAIANSLFFLADGQPLLVLTSGAHRADTKRLAELVGVRKVSRADPDSVRTHTGQVIGGVSPVGHPEKIRTLVDVHLAEYDVVWAAAGHPNAVYPTTFAELVAVTGGTPATVAGEQ